ncbi:MAG: tyrosine-type recombinase/integrase, partial [Betaproteobacteria bacterium]|nr:tyrosine-type recombinase/integrase [Betaproteobacteria bacterium]
MDTTDRDVEVSTLAGGGEEARERLVELVTAGLGSPHSRRAYAKALDEFLSWSRGRGAFSRLLVVAYRASLEQSGLAPSTVNLRLAAVRKLATEAAGQGWLGEATAAAALRVKGVKRLGVRSGNWLDRAQAEQLLAAPAPATLKGKRDRAILALLIGCGLRRAEAATLAPRHIQQRDGRWAIVDLAGKHARLRTVPMPAWAHRLVVEWMAAAALPASGPLFCAVAKGGAIRAPAAALTPQAIYCVVKEYATALGAGEVAPHDLRRTFGKLAHRGGP